MEEVKQVLLRIPWDLDERIERLAKKGGLYKRPFIIRLIEKQVEIEEHRSPSAKIKGTGYSNDGAHNV